MSLREQIFNPLSVITMRQKRTELIAMVGIVSRSAVKTPINEQNSIIKGASRKLISCHR
jgi:hypothetical protein